MAFRKFDLDDASLRTILVVDDDPVIRRSLKAQLARLGCGMVFASNGREALEAVAKYRPDLVLLDLVMPEVDGFEVCCRLKVNEETQDIPVLVLTGLEGDAKDRAFALGADDFLTKPPDFQELRSRIRSHLLIRSLIAEREERMSRAQALQWGAGRPARILVAMEDLASRETLVEDLRALGHEATGAPGLKEVLGLFKSGLPDLLVLDQNLPGEGTFLAHLRNFARSRDLPILLYGEKERLLKDPQAGEAGPLDFLRADYQSGELRVRVSVLLRQGRLLLERGAGSGSGVARDLVLDPFTGTFTEAFLEGHLDLVLRDPTRRGAPLALLAACGQAALPGDSEALRHTARILSSLLGPGETLCRVAERTFVLVLPGADAGRLREWEAQVLAGGFRGVLSGVVVSPGASGSAALGQLARALQRADTDRG